MLVVLYYCVQQLEELVLHLIAIACLGIRQDHEDGDHAKDFRQLCVALKDEQIVLGGFEH